MANMDEATEAKAEQIHDLRSRLLIGGANLKDQQAAGRIIDTFIGAVKLIDQIARLQKNTLVLSALWTIDAPLLAEASLLASYEECNNG